MTRVGWVFPVRVQKFQTCNLEPATLNLQPFNKDTTLHEGNVVKIMAVIGRSRLKD